MSKKLDSSSNAIFTKRKFLNKSKIENSKKRNMRIFLKIASDMEEERIFKVFGI